MEIQPLDIAAAGIVAAAALRGLFIGLLKEGFSLASLACAYLAVQLFTIPTAGWLELASQGSIGPAISPWIAGAAIAIGTVTLVILVGRTLQRTVHAAGLGWADRISGGFVGVAEGVLLAGILLVLGTEVLGRDHVAFRDTRSLAVLEEFERVSAESDFEIDVASPPRIF
jgi:uncharacterized membrane protein required for colicin V production